MTPQDQLDKIRACWLGKCLAGAIGAPWEGVPFPLDVGEKDIALSDVPNDDLELQLVWLDAVRRKGTALTARDLATHGSNASRTAAMSTRSPCTTSPMASPPLPAAGATTSSTTAWAPPSAPKSGRCSSQTAPMPPRTSHSRTPKSTIGAMAYGGNLHGDG